MIKLLTLVSTGCLVGALALAIADTERYVAPVLALLLVGLSLGALLGIRRFFLKAKSVVGDARRFMSGDIQHARIVEVGDPKGLFNPNVNLVLELEGEDGTTHRFDRDVPIPFPVAWSFRLGRRFKLPGLRSVDLTKMMAMELRRDGLDVSINRGAGDRASTAAAAGPPAP